ncbi:MAG TPA: HD domain-containing protein [Candidatus Gracilibacteria bacterium]|nr:HD domain-containing protein [Candidatus Gracilibacteria bacterium]
MSKQICNYIFELGNLKKFRHSGTMFAGVQTPDSIAEHAYRAAMIGYLLAEMEGNKNPEKVAFICLLHDNAEARITDLHKVARRYIETKKGESQAHKEQLQNLPPKLQKYFQELYLEYDDLSTKEGVIAKDADMIETAFQAKEYVDLGYKACQDWIDNVAKCIKTKSAKKLLKEMAKVQFTDWWRGLKKIEGY